MKISKSQLKQIIKEELLKEIKNPGIEFEEGYSGEIIPPPEEEEPEKVSRPKEEYPWGKTFFNPDVGIDPEKFKGVTGDINMNDKDATQWIHYLLQKKEDPDEEWTAEDELKLYKMAMWTLGKYAQFKFKNFWPKKDKKV